MISTLTQQPALPPTAETLPEVVIKATDVRSLRSRVSDEANAQAVAAPLPTPHATRHWQLNPNLVFLNHAQYGATPVRVLRAQRELRDRLESDPTRFLKVDLEGLMDRARVSLGGFLNCNPSDLALFRNATHGLCTILRSLHLGMGDEVLITEHEYPSLHNELDRMRTTQGIRVTKAPVLFPCSSQERVLESVLSHISPATRLIVVSHITSASSLLYPVHALVREANKRGIDIVVDGAHSPGQIPVDLGSLQPTFFVGSGHKWLSGPKGTGFVYVRPDRQARFRALAMSGRAHKVRPDRSLFLRDFDYQGSDDYTAAASIPDAIREMGSLLPGGWPALLRHNHELILAGREVVCKAIGIEPPTPAAMVGTMCTLPLPEPAPFLRNRPTAYDDALQDALYERHRIVTPVWRLPGSEQRVIRFSAQLYNTIEQFQVLGEALREELKAEAAGR